MQTIRTRRLTLRRFGLNDLDDLYAYAKSPNVGPAAGWRPHENLEDSLYVLRRFMGEDFIWAVVPRDTLHVAGSISLQPDPTRNLAGARKLGYSLGERFWGRGYATEAAAAVIAFGFDMLGLDVISVDHYPENIRSRRVIEKCGFRYEGRLRNAAMLYDGSVHDLCCYSITRDEYLMTRSASEARAAF